MSTRLLSELPLIQQIKSGKIWDFPGGIHPPERKELSNHQPLAHHRAQRIYLPIKQHIGEAGSLLVAKGDRVLKGQALTAAVQGLSLPVHASTSGTVVDIVEHVSAHPSGIPEPTLIIEPDGNDQWWPKTPVENWLTADKNALIEQIKLSGISGLGGAGFPTFVKAQPSQKIELLIINAVECEPYITADEILMRNYADELLEGVKILKHLVDAPLCLIGIEDNKPEAIDALRQALLQHSGIELRVVPTKYPSGGEKQLVQLLTGLQVPSGKIPADIGIVMQNVGTAYAVKRAIIDGEPLVSRIVTVTGENVEQAQNLWVPLGTPVKELLDHCGFKPEKHQRLIMGGPMMGFNIADDMMPVVKITNCILAPDSKHLPERGIEQPCIRCGLCADACPAELLPQQLQWFSKAKEHDKLNEYNLFDCIECGACAYVCPSQIPLVQYYRVSKAEIREAEQEKAKSDKAKIRFEQRQERLEREKQERMQRHKEAAEKRKQALEKDTGAKDKIAAALARAKAKKAQSAGEENPPAPNATNSTKASAQADSSVANSETSTNPQDKVAAAIARAKAKKAAKAAASESTEDQRQETQQVETPQEENPQKAAVAAAIARAKAKKAAQQQENAEQTPPEETEETVAEIDPKKAAVAAAIARAKAKKAAKLAEQEPQPPKESQPEAPPTTEAESEAKSEAQTNVNTTESTTELTAEQIRKEKVAAAIAKAKVKKQAQKKSETPEEIVTEATSETKSAQTQTDDQSENSEQTTEPKSPEQIRKEKVAAAIAKAKAKKAQAAQEQAAKETGNETE